MLGAQTPPFVAYVDMKEDIALAVWPGRNTSPMVKESPWGGRGRGEALRGGDQGSTFNGQPGPLVTPAKGPGSWEYTGFGPEPWWIPCAGGPGSMWANFQVAPSCPCPCMGGHLKIYLLQWG